MCNSANYILIIHRGADETGGSPAPFTCQTQSLTSYLKALLLTQWSLRNEKCHRREQLLSVTLVSTHALQTA